MPTPILKFNCCKVGTLPAPFLPYLLPWVYTLSSLYLQRLGNQSPDWFLSHWASDSEQKIHKRQGKRRAPGDALLGVSILESLHRVIEVKWS